LRLDRDHLAKIEGAAATAIRKFVATKPDEGTTVPPEIMALPCMAGRTNARLMDLEEEWIYHWDANVDFR